MPVSRKLTSHSVDLGSGVGNCVIQAALQVGCRRFVPDSAAKQKVSKTDLAHNSYGFELLPVPAHCARLQLREAQRRWAMMGLKGNLDVETYEGDFRTHPMTAKRLREADVVVSIGRSESSHVSFDSQVMGNFQLVNNEVFPPSLNADLTNLFLDLKEGATIVSLKPFVPDGFRMNESNVNTISTGVSQVLTNG